MSTVNITIRNDSSDQTESSSGIDNRNLFLGKIHEKGRTSMHKASADGDVETVQILVELFPHLSLDRDDDSMTPLHLAVMSGHIDVARKIITALPDSLDMLTDRKKSVLHLALGKYRRNQVGVFKFLLDEVKNYGKEDLLFKQDLNGNNVAHIATSKRLIKIVQLLQSSTNGFTKLVNSLNVSGHTALDLHYANKRRDLIARQIRDVLWNADAFGAAQLSEQSEDSESSNPRKKIRKDERKTDEMYVMLAGILIAIVFAALAGLPSFFPKDKKLASESFHIWDAVSGDIPIIFYILLCLAVILSISIGSMIKLCPIFFQLAMVAAIMVYVLLARSIMPNFVVKVGPHAISSFILMWVLTSTIILLGYVITILKEVLISSPKSTMAEDKVVGSSKSKKAVHLRRLSIRD